MTERLPQPIWISRLVVDVIHHELLAEHGGQMGQRAGGDDLIEAALARPQQRYAYDSTCDLADLAAAYAFGLARNHGWLDGNKRTGFAVAATFLLLNGARLEAPEPEAHRLTVELASGQLSEAEFAAWPRARSSPVEPDQS